MGMRCHVLIGLLLLLAACEEEKSYESCPFDKTITKACEDAAKAGSSTALTCLVTDHPQCPLDSEGLSPCLAYEGSEPFCTESCKKASDCPGDAACLEANDQKTYCVPCSETTAAPCPAK